MRGLLRQVVRSGTWVSVAEVVLVCVLAAWGICLAVRVTDHQRVNEQFADWEVAFRELSVTVARLNGPGNDIFATGRVAEEIARYGDLERKYQAAHRKLMEATARSSGAYRHRARNVVDPYEEALRRLDSTVVQHHRWAREIFEATTERHAAQARGDQGSVLSASDRAGAAMATMDQTARQAIDILDQANQQLHMWQSSVTAQQRRRVRELYVMATVALAMALGAAIARRRARHMHEQLKRSEARSGAIMDTAAEGIITTNERGIVELYNAAAAKIFGYAPGEVIGRNISMLMPSPRREGHDGYIARYLSTGERRVVGARREVTGMRKDGTTFPMEVHVSEVHYGGQRTFTGIVRDLTESKQAEEQLKRFRAALDCSADAVFLIDRNRMQFIDMNETACASMGYSRDELLAIGPHDIKPYVSKQELAGRFDQVIRAEQKVGVIETVHRRKDGSMFPVEVFLRALETEDGAILIASVRDITERKRVEEKLQNYAAELERKVEELAALSRELELARQQAEAANRLKSQFLANTSHELRTPLNGIMGYLKLVLDGRCDSSEEEREFINGAHESSKHLLGLISDVLDVAKIEAGKLQVELARVSLADLFHQVEAISRVQTAEKGLKIQFEPPSGELALRADAGRTKQVLINLVGNALKFTPRGGSIRVRAVPQPDEGHIRCEVSDTGTGIPRDKQAEIFQPFQQLDGSSTRQYGGAGLGLAIARRLVEMMGGFIWVESEPGQGSRFVFSLPVFDESAPVFWRRQADRRQGFERHGAADAPLVLVVEDDSRFRDYLCRLLQKDGFATIWAMTADDGLAGLRECRPAAVCIDYGLPAGEGAKLVTGWDLLVAIEKDPTLRGTGVIMVSGFDQELRRRLSVAGPRATGETEFGAAVPKLEKPIDPDEFIAAVRAACRPRESGTGTILLADDDPAVARVLEKALRNTGWQLVSVTDGRACIDYLIDHRDKVDLLVLDLMMPELDGFGVLRALRLDGVAPELPVVVLTSYPEMCTPEVSQLLELGTVVPILAKAELLSDPERLLELLNQRVLEPTSSA